MQKILLINGIFFQAARLAYQKRPTKRALRTRFARRSERLDPSTLPLVAAQAAGDAQRSYVWAGRSSQAGRTVFA